VINAKREGAMKPQNFKDKRGAANSAGKLSTVLLKMSSELIRVYLWFLQLSNYLLRLI
jgi:hypothetical protein